MHSEKFQRMYMEMSFFIASQNQSCGSRKVGCVIVDSNNKVKGIGYNGPPAGTPHCDSREYLEEVVWPRVNEDKRESLRLAFGDAKCALFACKGCPRRFLGYASGEATDLCSCQHAESNALINAACDVSGCVAYVTTPPCFDCAGKLINARIVEVHAPRVEAYSPKTEWLLAQAGVRLIFHDTRFVHDQGKS